MECLILHMCFRDGNLKGKIKAQAVDCAMDRKKCFRVSYVFTNVHFSVLHDLSTILFFSHPNYMFNQNI